MVRIGTPSDPSRFYCVDEGWLVLALHQAGCIPEWRDFENTYFRINNKLKETLKKLNIDESF